MTHNFVLTKKFQQGLETFKNLDLEVLKVVLDRLIKGESLTEPTESEQSQQATNLPPEALIAGSWILHIWEQSWAVDIKENTLGETLLGFGLSDTLARGLVRGYTMHTTRLKALDEKPPVIPYHVAGVDWAVSIQLAGPVGGAVHRPRGLVELKTEGEPVVLDLSHEECYELFGALEDIQEQIDSLGL